VIGSNAWRHRQHREHIEGHRPEHNRSISQYTRPSGSRPDAHRCARWQVWLPRAPAATPAIDTTTSSSARRNFRPMPCQAIRPAGDSWPAEADSDWERRIQLQAREKRLRGTSAGSSRLARWSFESGHHAGTEHEDVDERQCGVACLDPASIPATSGPARACARTRCGDGSYVSTTAPLTRLRRQRWDERTSPQAPDQALILDSA